MNSTGMIPVRRIHMARYRCPCCALAPGRKPFLCEYFATGNEPHFGDLCPGCWRLCEYFATGNEPHFWGLCPGCWRGLPRAVRAKYARK